jgi:hypothetical protein
MDRTVSEPSADGVRGAGIKSPCAPVCAAGLLCWKVEMSIGTHLIHHEVVIIDTCYRPARVMINQVIDRKT